MAFFLSRPNKSIRSCPTWAMILIAITIASIGTRLLFIRPRLMHHHATVAEWASAPWFSMNEVGSNTNNTEQMQPTNGEVDLDDFEVLFIGNSYTSVNDLSGLVKQIIDHQWKSNITIRSHEPGGQKFQGHLDSTRADYKPPEGHTDYPALHELRSWLVTDPLKWNWVVLQDQSQVPGLWDDNEPFYWEFNASYHAVQGLNEYVQKIPDAQTMFYLTWGRRNGDDYNPDVFPDYLTMQEKLTRGYEKYMEVTSTADRPTWVAPVGLVFENIYEMELEKRRGANPGTLPNSLFFKLYAASDGSHPSLAGSYLAALTMYASMLGFDPRDVKWIPEELDMEDAKQIQRAVAWTIIDTAAVGFRYPWQPAEEEAVVQQSP